MFYDETTGRMIPQRPQYHPDDLILDEPDRLEPGELWALTGHGVVDLREWDQ